MSDACAVADDNNLPRYEATPTKELTLDERIAVTPKLNLPILSAGGISAHSNSNAPPDEATLLARAICASFNNAISSNQDEVVVDFISRGLVTPDTPNSYSETPLLTAVRCGHVGMVRCLASLGAEANRYGQSMTVTYERGRVTHFQRTPLQYAAEYGHLAMVKVLMEECGADDSLVAPDGALALRLAAENGHREIVAYLPVRRGGGWRRWKVRHDKQMLKVKKYGRKIGNFLYHVVVIPPKLLLWTVPQDIWRHRVRIAKWLAEKLAKLPRALWKGIKALPRACKYMGKGIWRALAGIPKFLLILLKWLQAGIVGLARSIGHAAGKIISVLHTAVSALLAWFSRITLQDIGRGLAVVVRALFVDVPRAVFEFAAKAPRMLYEGLSAVLGGLGRCVYYAFVVVGWVLLYVPKKLFKILGAMGKSIGNAFNEVLVHIDPKRV